MTSSRTQHRAVLLPDGRVLIAGGNTVGPDGHTLDRELFSAEIFDPATGRFTAVTSAPAGGLGLHLALLQDGRVLALSATKLEFFDPRLGTFVPSSAAPSSEHGSVVVLGDGRVLLPDGQAELFEPAP